MDSNILEILKMLSGGFGNNSNNFSNNPNNFNNASFQSPYFKSQSLNSSYPNEAYNNASQPSQDPNMLLSLMSLLTKGGNPLSEILSNKKREADSPSKNEKIKIDDEVLL